jgi:hypothetical protein
VIFFICALIAVTAVGFTLFVREQDVPPAPVENPELKHLETRRQTVYENLKDLQFEYHQGKLSEEDYQSLKSGFLYELAGIMDAIERQQSKAPGHAKRAAVAANKPVRPATAENSHVVCAACSAANAPGQRFCGQCGAPLH